jgi:hypothetical protein
MQSLLLALSLALLILCAGKHQALYLVFSGEICSSVAIIKFPIYLQCMRGDNWKQLRTV